MQSVVRLARYAIPHRWRFGWAVAAMGIYAAASVALVALIDPIFNDILRPGEAGRGQSQFWAVASALVGEAAVAELRASLGTQFRVIAVLILGLGLAKGIGNYFSAFLMDDVGQRLVRDLRNELFRHILGQSAGFFARHSTGALMSRMMHDVTRIQQVVTVTLGDLLRESITVVGLAVWLCFLDVWLALVAMSCTPLVVFPLVRLGQSVRRNTYRGQEELGRLSHVTAEAFGGHRIVKAFAAERFEGRRFARTAERVYRITMKVTSRLSLLPPLMEWLGAFAVVGVLWYGSSRITGGEMTPGGFTAFVAALLWMYGPIKKLSRVNAHLQQAGAAAERVFEMLDTRSEVADRPSAGPLAPLRSVISFRDVGFAYDDAAGHPVLRGVSFDVEAGQMVAVVGLSGAGKTTLVNLLPRFYDVTAGAILIDGVDVRDVTLASLRESIGIVTQDTVLFDDTIAHNVAYASPAADRVMVEAAARAAHAHEFIAALPSGYDTRIGECGQRLSGGQRQRIAIARALLKNSPILILDEATSSLDAESELLVQDALAQLMLNRTSFVIAHRLSTVRRADAIIVLDDGRVREIGRHEELLADPDSHYARLYAMQFFERTPSPVPAGTPVGVLAPARDWLPRATARVDGDRRASGGAARSPGA